MPTAIAGNRRPRSERQQQRQVSILEAARSALTEKGYDGVTMNELAERAGVVRKTLYNLYGSKDDLLLAAISEVIDGYRGEALSAERGIASIVASRMAGARQVVATPEYAEAMARALMQAEAGHALVKILLKNAVADHVVDLDAAQADGELEPYVDVPQLAEQIVGQSWGVLLLWIKGLVPLDEFEARSVDGLLLLLLAVTRGPRRGALLQLLEQRQAARKKSNRRGGKNQ